MSLQDTLKQIRRQLAEWIEQQQRLRRRKLNVVRLEDRRLPDATFALIGNALNLNGFDGTTDSMDVSFDSSTSTLNLTLNSGSWLDGTGGPLDPALNVAGNVLSVDVGSLGSLSLLQIDGGASLKNLTDSGDQFSVQSLVVSGQLDVVLDSANDFDSIQVTANSLTLSDSDDLQIAGLDIDTSADITAIGDLTSSASAQLTVDGNLSVSGSSILLTEANAFGSLTFQSGGHVSIFENDGMLLTGSSSANSIDLRAANGLSDDSASSVSVLSHANFSAASITITGSFEAGSLSFHATDAVEIEEIDGMKVSAASEASVSLKLTAGDSLQIDGTMDVDGDVTLESRNRGDILLNAKLTSTGIVEFSSSGGIEINDDIDPSSVTLQSDDDIVVNAAIVATDQITIEAGLDGSGSFDLQAGGSLLVDNLANTAGIMISTGTSTGTVSVVGSITADALTQITSNESVNGSGLIQSHDLAIRAVTGIGSTGNLNTQVSNLSFRNSGSGSVGISNTGALSITGAGSINGTRGNELGNFGLGTTTISAASPLTINADVSSAGSMTLTAGETADGPAFADDLQINTGVTVSVTGVAATLTLRAGDDIVVQGRASATSGNLILQAGFSDLDGEGSIHFDGQLVAGQRADLNAITGINDDLTGNMKATSLRVLGSGTATLDNGHDVSNIAANFGGSLTFQNNTSFGVTTVGATSGITLTQPGATLDLTASAGAIGLSSDITTQGRQTFHSAVELRSNATIGSGSGDVSFASTLNSSAGHAFGIVVNSSGQTSFLDSVGTGASQELGFLTTDAAGSTVLSHDVETLGEQSFRDAVTLTGNITLSARDTDADGEGIDFGSTVTRGGNDLTILGGAGFAAAVSGVGALSADHIDSESTINASTVSVTGTADLGGNVTTTGEQVYSGSVLLTSGVTLSAVDTDADGEGVDFGSTVAGSGNDLTILGGAGFAAAVSGVGALSADRIDSESTISATSVSVTGTSDVGGDITTSGSQSYSGAVLLTANVELVSSGNQNITLNSTVDGAHNLTIRTGGVTSLNGDIGGTTRLNGLTTDAPGQTHINAANVKAGAIQFNDSVVLQQSATFDATTSVEFGSSVSGNSGSEHLSISSPTVTFDRTISNLTDVTVDASGQTTFNGNVNIAGLLRTDAPGVTKLNAATVTADTVQLNDAVELCQDTTITADRIEFGKTIDEAAVATGSDLTFTITNPAVANGDISIGGNVGATRKLQSITVTAANDVTFQGAVETDGAVIQQSGSGLTTFNGTGVSGIGGNLNITTNNVSFNSSNITTVGAISIVAANQILFNANAGLNSGSSTISLRANQDGTGNAGLIQQNGSVIRTTNATTNAIRIEVAGTGSASIGDVRATGRVTISAGGLIVDNSTLETANISADSVVLQAQSGIGAAGLGGIDTNVASLEALTVTGGIVISEANDITIGGVTGALSGLDASTSGNIQVTANGSISVTEGVNGSDDISLTAVGATSDLRVASGSGVTSVDGAVTLSADRTVTVSANVNTGATGTLTITGNANAGARNVIIDQGAIVSVVNGNLTIDADQGVQQTGTFEGVRIDNAEVRTSGSGQIVIDGRGGNSATGSQTGVVVTNSGIVRSSSTSANPGSIQIHGLGGTNAGNDNAGIAILAGGQVTSVNGDVQLTGIGGSGVGNQNHGVVINAGTVSTTGSSATDVGDVRVVGTKGSGANSNAIVLSDLAIMSVTNPNAANGATLTLESTNGDVTESSGATITANNLELLGDGNFALAESNQIGTLAADIDGTLDFRNASSLLVGTAGSTSGILSNNNDVRLSIAGGLTLGDSRGTNGTDDINVGTGLLTLDVTGNVTQQTGNSVIANGLELLGSGSVILEDTGNAVSTLSADFDGSIRFQTSSALTIGSTAGIFAGTSGITTQNDDVTICAPSIQLTHDVHVGAGTLRLQAATGAIDQTAGTLFADTLGARAAAGITLNSAGNDVNVLAADSGAGSLVMVDADGFTISSVSALGCFSPGVNGVTAGQDLELCVATGDIHLDAALNVTGTARLEATTGNVTSSAAGVISATNLAVRAAGNVMLDNATNQVDGIFVAASTSAGDIRFRDADGFTVDSIAAGACVGAVNGVVTSNGNILLTTDNGDLINQTRVLAQNGNAVLAVTNVGDIVLNGTTEATGSGHVLASTADGSVLVNGTVDSQTGNIRLNASGLGRDIAINADVSSQGGNVTLLAADSITTSAGVDIQTTGVGSVVAEAATGSITMNSASSIGTTQGSIRLQARSNATIGDLVASTGNVSLISQTGSILDADPNNLDLDVQAASLRISAAQSIGTLGAGGNAIETSVDTLSALAGSGGVNVLETNGLTIDSVSVTTQRVNSDGTTTAITDLAQSDVVTSSNGSIVLSAQAGNITLNDGTDGNGRAIQASGSGNVRLEAIAANGDLITNASITSGTGHLSLIAADDIVLNGSMSTSGLGTIYVNAGNGTADSAADGIEINQTIQTVDGDILLSSAQDLRQNATISSVDANVGLIAARDVIQTATGDIDTTAGNVLIDAGRDFTMSNGTLIQAGGDVDAKAVTGQIQLGQIDATHVALTANGSILDANSTGLNVAADTLSMRSAIGSIGTPGSGAIDTQVNVLAASASQGIAAQERDGLSIDNASAVSVTVNVQQVTTTAGTTLQTESRNSLALSDLTTTLNGNILLQSTTGSLTLNDGADGNLTSVSANGTGNVVIETVDAAGDITANASITTGTGHITVKSGDDIDVNASVSTTGAGSIYLVAANGTLADAIGGVDGVNVNAQISTGNGDVLIKSQLDLEQTALITSANGSIGLEAARDVLQSATGDINAANGDVLITATRHWAMSNGTTIVAGGGDVVGRAITGNIALGQIQSTNVALSAFGNVTDANNAALNVVADHLSIRAISGAIGGAGSAAIDTTVQTLAASAATGIAIEETDGLAVDNVAAVSVTINNVAEIHFDGSRTAASSSASLQTLDDLTTTQNGSVRLQTTTGSLVLNDGLDGDSTSVSANGTGDVLIQTLSANGDVTVQSEVHSLGGHFTINSGDDVSINARVSTTASGTLLIAAQNGTVDAAVDGVTLNAELSTDLGDVLVRSSQDVQQNSLISSTAGDVGLLATRDITQSATGDVSTGTGDVLVEAGRNWSMSNGTTIDAGGGQVAGRAVSGTIDLGQITSTNVALTAGTGITDANAGSLNVVSETLSLRATNGSIGGPGAAAIDTQVNTLAASAATRIAINELDGLTVDHVAGVSVQVNAVEQVLFSGTRTVVAESRTQGQLDDLTTTSNGDILLQSNSGSITLNDGLDNDGLAVSANGTGNVLIQTLAANGDVIVQSGVQSSTGHLTINAADDVDLNAALTTGGSGSIVVFAGNGTTSDAVGSTDGISIDGIIQTADGDVLIKSAQDIRQTAEIISQNGNIGVIAARDFTQTATGDVTTAAGDVLVEAGRNWTMGNGTEIAAGGGEFDGKAISGSLALGQIRATHVALSANGNITDANGAFLNVAGSTLSIRSTTGSIGQSHLASLNSGVNVNAIDTQVTTLAAESATGIYIEEVDSLVIDDVAAVGVNVPGPEQILFDGTTQTVAENRGTSSLNDLTTTNNGAIKVVTRAGSLTVNPGSNGAPGVSANGTGDVLLKAEGAGSDVILNTDILATTGHITIDAARSVLAEDDIVTSGTGSLLIKAGSGSVTLNDADGNGTGVQTAAGDMLIDAATNVAINAELQTVSGSVAIRSGNDILQTENIAVGGDLLIVSGRDVTMTAAVSTQVNGGELIIDAGRDFSVSLIEATNVAIEAGRDVLDSRTATQTNIRATTLRIVAGGEIGGANSVLPAATNLDAIDTEVDTLAARAANGIAIHEVAAGGALTIDSVADVTVSVNVSRANFNSSTTATSSSDTLSGLADLTMTGNGDLLLVTDDGTVTLNDGSGVTNGSNGVAVSQAGTGNVLIQAGGSTNDVVLNSDMTATGGHVTIESGDDIRINADVGTVAGGTISVTASNQDSSDLNAIRMQNGTVVTTAGGNVRLLADRDGTILLSQIDAGTGNASLLAEGSILDNNGSDLNVIADRLRMIADASLTNGADGIGIIGGTDAGANDANVNAIDTQVNILAAESAEGIFVREQDDLRVDSTGDIAVERVRFNSTTDAQTDQDLSDLTTTNDGTIRLQSATGSITLNDGTDGDLAAVAAHGTGNVLIQTLAANGDIVVNAVVTSDTGHVTVSSTDDVRISAAVQTGSSGTIVVTAGNGTNDAAPGSTDGIRVDGTITTDDGDILLKSDRDIRTNALIRSNSGDIGLIADRDIQQTNAGDVTAVRGDVLVDANRNWTMSTGTVINATNGNVLGQARTGTVLLGQINTTNLALSAGVDILDANGVANNVTAQTASLRAGASIGTTADRIETELVTLSAQSGTGIFISEATDLIVDTTPAITVTIDDVQRVNFNGSETGVPETRTLATLSDLSTSNNGSIHVRSEAGSITINGGTDTNGISANGSGDVRLEAIGPNSNVTLNASIISGSGDVVIISDRDVIQNNDGDIQTSNADVLIDAERNWTMAVDAEIESSNGAIGGLTHTGEMAIGRLTATTVMLNSAKSVSDANGTRLNVIATDLGIVASESIGDSSNAGTTPSALADAIDTNVTTLAASAHHGVFINELNSLVIGSMIGTTIGGSTFSAVSGVNSDNSDIFLNVGQNLTLNQSVNAGTADLRIVANGNVSQSANGTIVTDEFGLQQRSTTSGHVTLQSNNDVNVIAASNAFDGGDLLFSDVDNLAIRNVTSQSVGILTFSSTSGLAATGGDIQILAQGDITILRSITSRNGVVDNTSASGESIRIESVDGNIIIDATAGAIVVSTDEGPGSHASTGDQVTLLADSDKSYNGDLDGDSILDANDPDMDGDGIANKLDGVVNGTTEGKVTMLGDVTISSDGGVAKKFGPRPAVGESSTAFFVFSSSPLPVVIDNLPAFWNTANAYVDAFGIEIGIAGEENLTVDIDWRDPANEAGVLLDPGLQLLAQSLGIDNPVSSDRFQQFLIANGGQVNEIGHIYTTADMTLFQKVLNVTTIVIDLSVSHHESLNVSGAFIEQAGTGQSVPGLDVTSSDNPTNGFGSFDNGVATFKIPTVTPAPPSLFAAETTIRFDRAVMVAPTENNAAFASLVVSDFSGGAVSGSVFSTDVYFQIRRQFEVDGPTEVVVERISDSRLISSREALEIFVDQHPELQDGAGYEIWLISETGGQKVERPVVEFEITGGKPGPASEADQNSSEPPKLIDLPFEQPSESEDVQPKAELPGATLVDPMVPELDPAVPSDGNEALDADHKDSVSQVMPGDSSNEHEIVARASISDDHDESTTTLTDSQNGSSIGAYSIAVGTVAGISVSRFRQRQQSSEEQNRYSRAARFRRRHDGS